jgi:hypothetical protein
MGLNNSFPQVSVGPRPSRPAVLFVGILFAFAISGKTPEDRTINFLPLHVQVSDRKGPYRGAQIRIGRRFRCGLKQ